MNKPMESVNVGTSVGGLRLPLLRPLQEEVHVWVDAEKGQGKTTGRNLLPGADADGFTGIRNPLTIFTDTNA